MARQIVAQLWSGPMIVRRLGPDDPEPTQEELDEIATALIAANDCVRPVVRAIDVFALTTTVRGAGGASGPPGSVPR